MLLVLYIYIYIYAYIYIERERAREREREREMYRLAVRAASPRGKHPDLRGLASGRL